MKKLYLTMLMSMGILYLTGSAGAVSAAELDSEEPVARTIYEMEHEGELMEEEEDADTEYSGGFFTGDGELEIEEDSEASGNVDDNDSIGGLLEELEDSGKMPEVNERVQSMVEDILVSAGVLTSGDLTSGEKESLWEKANQKSERERIVEFALQFVGNPYVYGGTSLTGGCDCSGFVLSVFSEFGYSLPRVAADQYNASTKKDPGDLKPGDLIFYRAGIGHVAIYIGGGQIVHAANSELGIIVSDAEWDGPVGYGTFIEE